MEDNFKNLEILTNTTNNPLKLTDSLRIEKLNNRLEKIIPDLNISQSRNGIFILFSEKDYMCLNYKSIMFPDLSVNFIDLDWNKSMMRGLQFATNLYMDSTSLQLGKLTIEMFVDSSWRNFLRLYQQAEYQVTSITRTDEENRQDDMYMQGSLIVLDNLSEYLFHVNFYNLAIESISGFQMNANSVEDLSITVVWRMIGISFEKRNESFSKMFKK